MRALEYLFVLALVIYTGVILWHAWTKKLSKKMLWMFGIALTADICGTIFLCYAQAAAWTWNLHTTTGLASVLIMAAHFMWAVVATHNSGKIHDYFQKTSLAAWGIWLISFVSGLPLW